MRGCLLLQKLQYLIGGVHKLYGCKQCVQRQQYMQQGLYETTSALRDATQPMKHPLMMRAKSFS